MSDCEFNSMLSPYFDGELDELQQRRVERHLNHCDHCAQELERLGALSVVLAAARPEVEFPKRQSGGRTAAEQAVLARFVRRLTLVSGMAAALALAVWNYTAADQSQSVTASETPTLNTWERAAIDPVPTDNATATASAESQFDDFLVHDLGGIQ